MTNANPHRLFRGGAAPAALPARGGIGLKPEHYQYILDTRPAIGFFEVHAENYMVAGGPFHHYLERIRADTPLSIHGVGLSIGGDGPLDEGIEIARSHRSSNTIVTSRRE